MTSLINEESQIKDEKKEQINKIREKKKMRIKEFSKGTGLIPDTHKFVVQKIQKIDETNKSVSNSEGIGSHKANSIKKINSNEKRKVMNNKKPAISHDINYLNENEKEDLYALMGLVGENAETQREESIYSVEYLFSK